MISTSSPSSLKKPSSRATSRGRSWMAFIIDTFTFFNAAVMANFSKRKRIFSGFFRCRASLLPGAVVDDLLIGGARHHHVPLHRPVVGVVEALASIRLRRSMQQTPGLKLVRLKQTAGLADEI